MSVDIRLDVARVLSLYDWVRIAGIQVVVLLRLWETAFAHEAASQSSVEAAGNKETVKEDNWDPWEKESKC